MNLDCVCRLLNWCFTSIATILIASSSATAAERALSGYVPAYYGDFGVAVAPAPGTYGYATSYNFFAKLPVGPNAELKLKATALISGFQYVAPERIGDISIGFGAYTGAIDATLVGKVPTAGGSLDIDEHKIGQSDTSVSPLILYWSQGNLHVSLYEAVRLPTGKFKASDTLNLSRNYISFDSVMAITWLDQKSGWELSIVPGILANLENPATDYRTGTEFHVDAMLNRYLSKTFAVGLHGYAYGQLESDKSGGTVVDGMRSSAFAIGPTILWLPSSLGFEGKLVLKWMHDLDAENRFAGDVVSATAALKF